MFFEQHCLFLSVAIRYPLDPQLTNIGYNRLLYNTLSTFSDVLYCKPNFIGNTRTLSKFPIMELVLATNEINKLSKVMSSLIGLDAGEGSVDQHVDDEFQQTERLNEIFSSLQGGDENVNSIKNDKKKFDENQYLTYIDNMCLNKSKMDQIETITLNNMENIAPNFTLSAADKTLNKRNNEPKHSKSNIRHIFDNSLKGSPLLGLKTYYFVDYNTLPLHLKEWLNSIEHSDNFKKLADTSSSKDSKTLNLLLHGFKGLKKL